VGLLGGWRSWRIAQGEIRSQLTLNIDLTFTILEWGGATAGDILDGRSLVPVLNDAATLWRRAFAVEVKTHSLLIEPTFIRAVRAIRFLYARFNSKTVSVR
jgi:hypothetical protein